VKVLEVRNVNDALGAGLHYLQEEGYTSGSRNGTVRVSSQPVTTLYKEPTERVIFDEKRDANPFFHFFESLWMLAGRNDLAFVKRFAKNMQNYSDDGKVMWGAYGWRWRSFFDIDQIDWAITRLSNNKEDRRVVIAMWDGRNDPRVADEGGKDVPCNVTLHLQINRYGELDMSVFNRSNDIIWGAYGANAVHFSFLQEYIACSLSVPVGRYWQISDNYHAYEELYEELASLSKNRTEGQCPYSPLGGVVPFPLMSEGQKGPKGRSSWDQDLLMFLDNPTTIGYRHAFFRRIAIPMWNAHAEFKNGKGSDKYEIPLEILSQMPLDNDWRKAAEEWIRRRFLRFRRASDDGVEYS
jgi:thymidylate synthase